MTMSHVRYGTCSKLSVVNDLCRKLYCDTTYIFTFTYMQAYRYVYTMFQGVSAGAEHRLFQSDGDLMFIHSFCRD